MSRALRIARQIRDRESPQCAPDFPRIVSEFDGVTGIAIGYGMPSERTHDEHFRPLCTVVIQVPTRSVERVLERIRSSGEER